MVVVMMMVVVVVVVDNDVWCLIASGCGSDGGVCTYLRPYLLNANYAIMQARVASTLTFLCHMVLDEKKTTFGAGDKLARWRTGELLSKGQHDLDRFGLSLSLSFFLFSQKSPYKAPKIKVPCHSVISDLCPAVGALL